MLDKHFDPTKVEQRLYEAWEKAGAFKPSGKGEPFCIVIPPPNVTGSLHMGHALNNTLQDILVRMNRMRGKDVLWQPGTDHAGIATQMVVERKLAAEGKPTRWEMGREKFLEEVWKWKEESGNTIINQLKRLGASCDWSRLRFTMDEGLSRAVLKVFVTLWKEGLIYKDKRLVNWDPKLLTAISDLEVENVEVDGHMWHFKYPLANGETYTYVERDEEGNVILEEERDYISIATTRPETMLGDGAVAVHPSDERYAPIVGKLCEIPVGPKHLRRHIPIITDEYPDPNFGSGAVKITGAHDFNDYEVARRNNIPLYRLMDEHARMRADGLPYEESAKLAEKLARGELSPDEVNIDEINLVPEHLRGLDRYEAREKVIEEITEEGLAVMVPGENGELVPLVENKKIMQPMGDRSHVVIEPMLTDQWFVDAAALASGAMRVVERGDTKFFPANWTKTYFEWLRNIQPWCISRQLWWGHRIPAWYGPDGKVFVAETEEQAQKQAEKHYGEPVELRRDPDVLDTWFSSALWPFSTLGWPDDTPELKRYYPTSVLITGFDIIFFWVARMMMMGLHFMHDVPFRDVYIHALVRDEHGAKMSKSKGNVIDPLELITKYGADALRFTLAIQAVMGRDIRLSEARVQGYRNFGTKLWNAVRFLEMNEVGRFDAFDPAGARLALNRWIVGEAVKTIREVTRSLDDYRFNDAAAAIYHFTWDVFCDWYLELIKPVLKEGDAAAREETRKTAAYVRDVILKLLHPFMPFITEELWQRTGGEGFLMLSSWPQADEALIDKAAAEELDWVIRFIRGVRSTRAEMNVPAGAQIPAVLVSADEESRRRLKEWKTEIMRLARLSDITLADEVPPKAAQIVHGEAIIALPLEGVIDLDAEIRRLEKELAAAEKEMKSLQGRLANENFLKKAKPEVVEQTKQRLEELKTRHAKLEEARARLAAMA